MDEGLKSTLHRQLRYSERGLPWLTFAAVGVATLLALLFFIRSGFVLGAEPFVGVLRGYTKVGVALGVLALLLSLASFFYVIRKRALQESAFAKGSMVTWLWAHIVLGGLAYVAVLVHGGAGLLDQRITWGDVAFWACTLVMLSGGVWRWVYKTFPSSVVSDIGNYSIETSEARIQQQTLEMEKLAAGSSPMLHEAKQWLRSLDRSDDDVALSSAAGQLSAADREVFWNLVPVSASLHRAKRRLEMQAQADRSLQGWRRLHVPLSLLVALLVALHVASAYRLPSRLAGLLLSSEQLAQLPGSPTGHHLSSACADCHQEIYQQWTTSMHAHAQSSPVTVVQNNQVARSVLRDAKGPDPARICVQCHSPIGSLYSAGNLLPLGTTELQNQGVGCTTCHQFTGEPASASGGVSDGMMAAIEAGPTMWGSSPNAVGNAYHRTLPSPTLSRDPTDLCQNCHNVHVDRDGSGNIDRAHDLVLQMTHLEYTRYRQAGGAASCLDCHMPVEAKDGQPLRRSAEAASIPFAQDTPAPARVVRSHRFVGVDYPLSEKGAEEPNAAIRHALLRSAAALRIESTKRSTNQGAPELDFSVAITNTGAGHDIPTGFAFARQMWLEVTVADAKTAQPLFSSGQLGSSIDDLCDANTMDDASEALLPHLRGCTASDPQLVNLQKKLVTKTVPMRDEQGQLFTDKHGDHAAIQADDGFEVPLQHLTGGAVVRVRPADGALLSPISPGETRRWGYRVPLPSEGAVRVSVRLLFRHLPPYFLRQLAAGQPKTEEPRLAPLIENLEVVEMASAELSLEPAP